MWGPQPLLGARLPVGRIRGIHFSAVDLSAEKGDNNPPTYIVAMSNDLTSTHGLIV